MPPANVLVLDFDGVLCASAQETAVSAWRAGQRFFPEWSGPEPSDEAIAAFTAVRPILETGYQSILLMKRIVDGIPVDEIRAFGSAAAEELVATLGLARTELIAAFGGARDAWIEADLPDCSDDPCELQVESSCSLSFTLSAERTDLSAEDFEAVEPFEREAGY